jgi:hypothetical protein
MLTGKQAQEIVADTLKNIGGGSPSAPDTLADAGITGDMLDSVMATIVGNAQIGVARFQHRIDPDDVPALDTDMPIDALSDLVQRLAAGKLCSNSASPHPQTCCPYPTSCPQCGYPVY